MSTSSGFGDVLSVNSRVVIVGFGGFFGLILFICGLHVYVKCRGIGRLGSVNPDIIDSEQTADVDRSPRRDGRRRHYPGQSEHLVMETVTVQVGLDSSVVKQLPMFVLSAEDALEHQLPCAVCLEEFAEGESVRKLPKCSHYFHVECIGMWLLTHSSCPLCREVVTSGCLPCSICIPFMVSADEVVEEEMADTGGGSSTATDMPSTTRGHPLSEGIGRDIQRDTSIILDGRSPAHASLPAIGQQHVDDVPRLARIEFRPEAHLCASGLPSLTREATIIPDGDRTSFFTIQIRHDFQ